MVERHRRLGRLLPGDLDAHQANLYQMIVGGPRANDQPVSSTVDAEGSLAGPFGAMLLSPALGVHMQALGAAIRYESSLPPRVREAAILMVADREKSSFEWSAHHPIAISAGLTPADLSTIRAGGAPAGASPLENALLVAATALVQREEFDDAAYADAVACAGERSLFELCALVGYYRMLALTMRVFGIE
ncbi:MAG: carboxymuconolactone decarboxylase family protein [Actinomycetota bacterium]|nr:carboxymuconolactone decarboxylase family protein [Actinomycetota bacterium]